MTFLMTLICAFVFFFEPHYTIFTICVFGVYFCVGFVDTLAEGMTALITKMEDQKRKIEKSANIVEMVEGEKMESESDKNKKAIGNYLMFKMFVKTIGMFLGGILADKVRIGVIYGILGIFPILLNIWTIFFFKEEKVNFFYRYFYFFSLKNFQEIIIFCRKIFSLLGLKTSSVILYSS